MLADTTEAVIDDKHPLSQHDDGTNSGESITGMVASACARKRRRDCHIADNPEDDADDDESLALACALSMTAAKAQLLVLVMAVLWIRSFRCLPDGTTVAYVTLNGSHVQMIRQGGMSESESLWNAIDFLQRAFQDQPELFGSRSMEALFGTGTALYDAAKRLVPDSGNAVAATERGLEYSPLIATALVECVFFDAGVPGPVRKARTVDRCSYRHL